MEYQFEVINKDGGNTLWNSLWIPIPNTTNYQYNIDLTEITPEPSKIYTDPEHNNTVLYYENAPAVISGSCEYSRKPPFAFDVDPQKIGQYDKNSPLYKLYTRSETWIEADAPEIASKAEEIVEGLDNPYAKAQHIHDFVCNYLTPEQIPWTTPEEYFDAYGALATYKRGSGTCHNYALVFVALCRAEGIPARTVHGINFFEGLLGEKIGIEDWSHAWAEFYLPEYGWITVDPSQNQFAEVSNLRLAYSMGNNITLNPPCNSPDTWYCHEGTAMSLGYTVPFTEERITIEKRDPENGNNLYFPHVASDGQWKTEITVVNKSSGQVAGTLAAYDGDGNKLEEESLELSGHARRARVVGEAFPDPDEIRYMVFSADSADVCGYTKFCQEGKYRVAVPAVREKNRDAIHVPHIASDDAWWTGLALVNTTDTEKTLTIRFDTGRTETVRMDPGAQKSFSIRDRLGAAQPDIESAEIEGGAGVIGLELFGHKKEPQLSGVLLRDACADTLYFPHVATEGTWWT
ncbi:MAG: transglutaminase domain-containing protein, partial [Desulfosalsimonadaceae bacterium]